MSGIVAVARLELQQSLLRPLSLALGAFFALLVVGAAYAGRTAVESLGQGFVSPDIATAAVLVTIAAALAVFGPIVPIVSSVLTIVEERSTHTIDLLLSRPVSRRGLVLGKLLGRVVHVLLVAVVGLALGLLVVLPDVPLAPPQVAFFVVLVALLCAAWVALAVLLSSLVRTPNLALVSAFGVYLAFLLLGPVLGRANLGGLAPVLNPNTLFLGSVRASLPVPDVADRLLAGLTAGLDAALALPLLAAYVFAAAAVAVVVFDRQDEAGG